MKVLMLTIGQIHNLKSSSVHIDIAKELKKQGHEVSILCTREKRLGLDTEFVEEEGIKVLRLRIGNITQCSMIEKGFNTIFLERQFIRAIKKYFGNDQFDLVIYNTPPVTLVGPVKYAKKKFKCKSYLMLKDIFPQNAVDLNMMSTTGLGGILYKLFRKKEIGLYKASDRIGCMSPANMKYLLEHNSYIDEKKVELFPNAVFSDSVCQRKEKDKSLLAKYGIDTSKPVFIYGGNLGKPQGLDFMENALKYVQDKVDCSFVIVGSGTEKKHFYDKMQGVKNVYMLDYMPHEEYEQFCASCDVGMVMLDHRFTIPNYPSRALSYLENAMPIFACTDKNTDIKELVEDEAKCGKWCCSNSVEDFLDTIEWFVDNKNNFCAMGENGRKYLEDHFVADKNVRKLEAFVKE